MENKDKLIQELFSRLDHLARQQKVFQDEIQKIHQELTRLKSPESEPTTIQRLVETATKKAEPANPPVAAVPAAPVASSKVYTATALKPKTPWEDFIGQNLLNKVGIAVLVLGIGFGAKYSIDHDLINPLTRIIFGYVAGLTLLGIAFRLRTAHTAFSAVLLSGGMAVLYFITYAAYSFYMLVPQGMAFVLMVSFTAFTVLAAVRYNLEVIGVIGLVGAYAVPVLLSDGSGRIVILFSYIGIINMGILVLAFRKYWKRLYYLAFVLTWLTFASWYAFSFDRDQHIAISLTFSTLFFITFYATFLAYKLVRTEPLGKWDVVCMLFNSFLYFGYGYLTVESIREGEQYLGLFTVLTALIHFVAVVVIYKAQARFGDTFYFVAGMVLVFLTIAVPVQLEGNWVTLVWAAEATLLFWIGRTKSFPTYEKLSYPLIVLAFLSLLHDWDARYPSSYYYGTEPDPEFVIFLNVQFLTSLLVAVSFCYILWINNKFSGRMPFRTESAFRQLVRIGLPLLTVFVFYVGFYKEIEFFWNNRYADSRITVQSGEGAENELYNQDLLNLKTIWLIVYSAVFAWILYLVQLRWRTELTSVATLLYSVVVLVVFITAGLLDLSELRSHYLEQDLATYYPRGYGHVLVRYLALVAIVPLMWLNRKLVRQPPFNPNMRRAEDLFVHFITIVLLSSELIHWLDMLRVENSFKLALSILWGAYGLFLIVFGLSRDARHIRLGAMVLFAVTLIKLFAYDMEDMDTLLKTVVMVVLGALLLTASFIYNKHKRSAGNEAP